MKQTHTPNRRPDESLVISVTDGPSGRELVQVDADIWHTPADSPNGPRKVFTQVTWNWRTELASGDHAERVDEMRAVLAHVLAEREPGPVHVTWPDEPPPE